jgi:hypothetical protein
VKLVAANGASVSELTIGNDDEGFSTALPWLAQIAPRPARRDRPERHPKLRRRAGKGAQRGRIDRGGDQRQARPKRRCGKSVPIDAHLAALANLRWKPDRL